MTPRRRRIERILAHRQKELDDATAVFAAVKVREAAAVAEAETADAAAQSAIEARRKVAEKGSGVLDFIEAEEWLYATARRAQRAWMAVANVRREVEKVLAVVTQARTKLKQAEHLAARVALGERKISDRRERRGDDEAAARMAQRKASMAGAR